MQQITFREHPDEIREVVDAVFGTMLDMRVQPVSPDLPEGSPSITSAVHFEGPWKGVLMIECSQEDACSITEVLAGVPCPRTPDDTVRDALSELTHTVGGNLKGILPSGVSLSMSMVVQGSGYQIWFSDGKLVSRMAFECAVGTFRLHVIEMQP